MNTGINRTALTRWWQGLAERERTLIGVGALVVAAVLVDVLAWDPAAVGIRRLSADLPALREQNAAMRAMADEAASMRAAAGNVATIGAADRAAAVRRSLERAGLWSAAGAIARPVDAAVSSPQTVRTLTVGGPVTTVAAAAARATPPDVTADGDRVRVRFDDVDYGVWAGWLASAESELSARASRVSVASTAPKSPVGHVRAEAVFDWTPPGPASTVQR